jgi:hypothetical protein
MGEQLASYGNNPPPVMSQEPGEEAHARSDREFLNLIQREIDSALGWAGTRLAEARRMNLNEYFGNTRGDEREGRSQVICRDTFEQVEMLMPPLMEIFTSGSETGRYIPEGPEDEDAAEQATAVANYVVRSEEGFMVLYTMFKDALIQKNGIVKVFWDSGGVAKRETYDGKTFQELDTLLSNPEIELIAATPWVPGEGGEQVELDPAGAGSEFDPTQVFYDVVVRRVPSGRIRLENIPPEEFIINRDARSLQHRTCRFAGHRVRTTVSELVEIGVDEAVAKRLPTANSVFTSDQDAIIRASQDDGNPLLFSHRTDTEKIVVVTECYILADLDGDGVSEWWKALVAGDYGQELLHKEPCDGHPFAAVTPIPIPHRFYGLGLADVTADIQNINTTLWRQFLDANYLAVDPSYIVLSEGEGENSTPMVNLNQLVNTTPGSYVEEFKSGALRPLERSNNAKDILPAFEVHGQMKERRTGLSPEAMGVQPEAISKHVFGAMIQTSAAAQRIGLYARIFADTGVKDIFRLIYKTYLKNATQAMTVRLRGDWVEIDPSSWKDNWDVQITVGLGHGSRMEKVANLQAVGQMQQLIGSTFPGMVGPDHAFNTFAETVEAMGFKDATKFCVDPMAVELPEPPPDPAEVALEKQVQIEAMKIEVQRQKVEVERYKAQIDAKAKELEHEREMKKLAVDEKKIEYDSKRFDINKAVGGSQ